MGDFEQCSFQTEKRLLAVLLEDQAKFAQLTYESTDWYKNAYQRMEQLDALNRSVRRDVVLSSSEVRNFKFLLFQAKLNCNNKFLLFLNRSLI